MCDSSYNTQLSYKAGLVFFAFFGRGIIEIHTRSYIHKYTSIDTYIHSVFFINSNSCGDFRLLGTTLLLDSMNGFTNEKTG